jgi:hypothetical protein
VTKEASPDRRAANLLGGGCGFPEEIARQLALVPGEVSGQIHPL